MIGDTVNDMHGNEFWMSVGRLAEKARVDRKTATKALAALLKDGFLELLEERPGGTNRYRFQFPEMAVAWDSRRTVETRADGRKQATPKVGRETSPSEPPRWGVSTHQVGTDASPGGASRPTNSREQQPTQDPLVMSPSIEQDFEDWWKLYPKKIEKASALKAYRARRVAKAPSEALIAAVRNYATAVEHTERQYVKHAATFLNNSWSEWVDGPPKDWSSGKVSAQPLLSHPLPKHADQLGPIADLDPRTRPDG